MANCCPKAMSFFGVIQRIYTLFTSSTKWWNIFKDHVKGLTIKPLSQTRWESHVESVKPIKEQIAQIRDVFYDLANVSEHPKTKSEAESLALYELQNFEFLLGVVIWYKKDGYDKAMIEAKEMSCEMGIEAVFQDKRVIRRKKQFGETRSSMKAQFEQFQKYEETFGFLFNLERLQRSDDENLLRSCKNLENSLTHKGCSDINDDDLFSELTFLRCSLPREAKSAIDVLNYLKKMDGCFPNAHISYKILLTASVTVASAKPRVEHWKAIIRLLRYLRYTRDHGLHYNRYIAVVEGYIDANWISDMKDSKSKNGFVFTLGGAAIAWNLLNKL
ncbi:uncharacterized protein [Primulina eburnea]|uniref:uncharacterized protein n=1 Tax=Primulina eburnea TaxID=1245227 RepID=UPI003C6C7150